MAAVLEQIGQAVNPAGVGSVRTAVAGVSGYAGAELARLLLAHPRLQQEAPLFLGRMDASSSAGAQSLYEMHPQLARHDGARSPEVVPFTWEQLQDRGTEVLFLALPHEQSREWVPEAVARGMRVIDLSGAWRLHDPANEAVYRLHDADRDKAASLQVGAVYGCPELHRSAIESATLVANPGCYATSIILALAPLIQAVLLDLDRGIIADAKSGVSGAGKAPTPKTHFMYAADNLSAYGVFGHRHTGELLEQLGLTADQIQFTPHLLPIPRGILSTIYARLAQPVAIAEIERVLRSFYTDSPMVRVRRAGDLPQIAHVARTNYCDIGFEVSPDGKRLVLVSCLDNLLKGAAGQAVQNLNVMCGWSESEGLL
ncbi:N-acetyl-gamma-glutamyl-phosphate reductase [Terriglobus sp.]|uniref:N-acetyl-gamma-glutamyl-phosphate reductase n=1 Tax=Terriglobus sp. TaxID=1889013 RepID=UPI003B00E2E6